MLAALAMARLVFSVGFGNIFYLPAPIPTPALQDGKKIGVLRDGGSFFLPRPRGTGVENSRTPRDGGTTFTLPLRG